MNSYNDYSDGRRINNNRSVRGLEWLMHQADDDLISMFMQRLGISEITARIMCNRNVRSVAEARSFLSPKIKDLMPDPSTMLGADKAVKRVIRALNDEEKITVFADYDVDGATSGALLCRFFKSIGEKVDVYVPNRFTEGYGPSNYAFDKMLYNGTTLVIIVDCGSVAFEPLAYAKKIGLDVIVLDHHATDVTLPEAVAILNPNRQDETFQPRAVAAVAVVFLFLVALRAEMRKRGWFDGEIKEPDMMSFLDLVALGTVCDMMPLIPLNRAFIKRGLDLIREGNNYGITAILDMAKIKCPTQSHHLGYTVGPRINAGGRVDDSSLGFKLLSADSYTEALKIAESLESLNNERKTLELLTVEEAMLSIRKSDYVTITVGYDWHQGVLGIVASRLKEEYHKPTFVITVDESTGIGKGSARSIHGVDVAEIIQEAKNRNIIIEGGGHAMAGGFGIHKSKIDEFCNYIEDYVKNYANMSICLFDNAKKIMVDGALSIPGVRAELFEEISKLEPFGLGNPKPYFIIEKVAIRNIAHSKGISFITIYDTLETNVWMKCLCFTTSSSPLLDALNRHSNKIMSILGTLQGNNLQQGQVNFVIEDIYIHD